MGEQLSERHVALEGAASPGAGGLVRSDTLAPPPPLFYSLTGVRAMSKNFPLGAAEARGLPKEKLQMAQKAASYLEDSPYDATPAYVPVNGAE